MNIRPKLPPKSKETGSPSNGVLVSADKFGVDSVDYTPVNVGRDPMLIKNSMFSSSSDSANNQRKKLLEDDQIKSDGCCCRRQSQK